ncbi:MAG: glycoside hydrolase family 88 protein [Bacteroidales bacterium]|nr:glycoside hydrolase family 88 protein [Bacteroidales bacterium]
MKNKLKVFFGMALIGFSACIFNAGCKGIGKQSIESKPWSLQMAESLIQTYPDMWLMEERTKPVWSYTYGLIGMSLQILSEKTGDQKYFDYVKQYADTMIDNNGVIRYYKMQDYNIDHVNPGRMVLNLYKKTGEQKYKAAIDSLRNQLVNHPRTNAGGFWHKKRYPHQMWLDGVYMGAPFMAEYAKQFNQPEMFDDIANWILKVEEKTRDSKTGLLYHAWDESREQQWADSVTGCSPHFWGRAMGWYAMALVDVLDYFPAEHPKYNEIVAVLNRLTEAVVNVQDDNTGLWYQVLDQGNREGNYLEGSVSSMLAYTMLKSLRLGYIDKKYNNAAVKAYEGIINNLIKRDENGLIKITPVCAVAGLGGNPYRDGSYEYYINERKRDNDPKATGPFILASLEYEAMKK